MCCRPDGVARATARSREHMRRSHLYSLRAVGAGLLVVIGLAGCGTASTTTTGSAGSGAVALDIATPTRGSVSTASEVPVRGTVTPADATVQIQGRTAAVSDGVFVGAATLHTGRTNIDVTASAPGAAPTARSVVVDRLEQPTPHSPSDDADRAPASAQAPAAVGTLPTGDHADWFQSPSGNVRCLIDASTARCSVASAQVTFVLPSTGGRAYSTPGLLVPAGEASVAPYGTARSDGIVSCEIPDSNVPMGIVCRNNSTGHGFEASRVPSRQEFF